MKLVVGLGNPGSRYRATRHNVGFQVVEEVAREEGWPLRPASWWRSAEGRLNAEEVVLAQPLTFMNDSGRSVRALTERLQVSQEGMLVVCDDLNIGLGEVRLRRSGSSGGHKGLASIARELQSEGFARLRIGVGPPRGEVVEFVLSEFSREERPTADRAVVRAAEAVRCWVTVGIEEAMNRFNRKTGELQGGSCETV
jgi:PTH1 family peptidyl-tRNA hydrolase